MEITSVDLNQRKEQFSNAYLQAVASVAGFVLSKPQVDEDSVDWCVAARGARGTVRSPKIDLQLKCTAAVARDKEVLAFPLKIKNYNELRLGNYQVPRILVVVVVPDRIDDWLAQSEEELSMRHCGYWHSLRGFPESPNSETVTVRIPRAQQFTVESLDGMMERVSNGGLP